MQFLLRKSRGIFKDFVPPLFRLAGARLIEKMAEVGSGSSMTSNHEIEIVQRAHAHQCTVKLS